MNESALLLCTAALFALSGLYAATLHCFGSKNVQLFVIPIKHLNVNVRACGALCVSLS